MFLPFGHPADARLSEFIIILFYLLLGTFFKKSPDPKNFNCYAFYF